MYILLFYDRAGCLGRGSKKMLRDLKGKRSPLAGGLRGQSEACTLQGGFGLTMHT